MFVRRKEGEKKAFLFNRCDQEGGIGGGGGNQENDYGGATGGTW